MYSPDYLVALIFAIYGDALMGFMDIFKEKKKKSMAPLSQASQMGNPESGPGLMHSPIPEHQSERSIPQPQKQSGFPINPPPLPPSAPLGTLESPDLPPVPKDADLPPMPEFTEQSAPEFLADISSPEFMPAPQFNGFDANEPPDDQLAQEVLDELQHPVQHTFQIDDEQILRFSRPRQDEVPVPAPLSSQKIAGRGIDLPPPPSFLDDDSKDDSVMDAPPALDASETEDTPVESEGLGDLPSLPKINAWKERNERETAASQKPTDMGQLPKLDEAALPKTDRSIPNRIPDLELFSGDEAKAIFDIPEDEQSFKKLQDDLKKLNQPIYVNMNEFGDIIESVNAINTTLHESDMIFNRLRELKDLKEKKLVDWHKSLEEIQRKLVYLDNKVFEVL